MSVIKDAALKEPIVDVVDETSVVSDSAMIYEFDIHTVTKEQFSFKSSFTLVGCLLCVCVCVCLFVCLQECGAQVLRFPQSRFLVYLCVSFFLFRFL
jgi:Arginine methyltransferase oligomerization subdomain